MENQGEHEFDQFESMDLDDVLKNAVQQLEKAKKNVEHNKKRNEQNVSLLESVVSILGRIKKRNSGEHC